MAPPPDPPRERQLELLAPAAATILERPGLRLRFWPGWLGAEEAEAGFARLLREVPWRQEALVRHGRRRPLPRLSCWMADPGCRYSYSGVHHAITAWTPTVQRLRRRVERAVGARFNAVLLHHYRDGLDGMGWHADDESELVPDSPIASLSLGSARSFRLRPRDRRGGAPDPLGVELGHGDLLVMDPPTQRHWQHQLPRRRRLRQGRINLTFRLVRPAPGEPFRAWQAGGPVRTGGEG